MNFSRSAWRASKQMMKLGTPVVGADGISPTELFTEINARTHALVDEQYRVLNEVLIPALEKEKIRFVRRSHWTPEQDAWLRSYFQNELLPVLSPLGLDPAHPFPRILNKSLNFIVSLSGKGRLRPQPRLRHRAGAARPCRG